MTKYEVLELQYHAFLSRTVFSFSPLLLDVRQKRPLRSLGGSHYRSGRSNGKKVITGAKNGRQSSQP
jgi:hypothetical protein